MQPPSNPNSTEKKPSELRDNVMDSCPRFAENNKIPNPNGDQEMKMRVPLHSHQHKSSLLILAPPENPRVTLSLDKAIEYELKHGRKLDPKMDRKKLRRTVSNRLSAQRSRLKKAQYINDMEKMVIELEELISVLTPRIESYKEKRKLLQLQNDSLKRLLEIRSNESKLSEIELEKNRMEVYRLKELEKTLSKNCHDSNPGGQQMQDLMFEQLIPQQCTSLGFYENGLQKLGSKQFCQEQLSSCALDQSGVTMAPNFGSEQPAKDQQQGFATKLPVPVLKPKKNPGEAEIDQYLKFED